MGLSELLNVAFVAGDISVGKLRLGADVAVGAIGVVVGMIGVVVGAAGTVVILIVGVGVGLGINVLLMIGDAVGVFTSAMIADVAIIGVVEAIIAGLDVGVLVRSLGAGVAVSDKDDGSSNRNVLNSLFLLINSIKVLSFVIKLATADLIWMAFSNFDLYDWLSIRVGMGTGVLIIVGVITGITVSVLSGRVIVPRADGSLVVNWISVGVVKEMRVSVATNNKEGVGVGFGTFLAKETTC